MKPYSFTAPQTLEEQKAWALQADGAMMDTEYYHLRTIATRRMLLAGVEQALDALPQVDRVVFRFQHDRKSIKESIRAYGDTGDKAADDKAHAKFDKMMGSTRSRCGQSVNVFETLTRFFGHGQELELTRRDYKHMINAMFDERLERVSPEWEANERAKALDASTPQAPSRTLRVRL